MSRTQGLIFQGSNSGYQAIGLAYQFGVSKIILVGYDMQHTGGKAHWHEDYKRGMNNASSVHAWIPKFGVLAKDLEAEGVDVVNCSVETALKCFRRSTLEVEL